MTAHCAACESWWYWRPQLYNLKDQPAFGHGSSQPSVWAMLDYKNRGVQENPRVATKALAEEFQPLGLSSVQLDALADFGENGLFDASLRRYLPKSLPRKSCFPDNDPLPRQGHDSGTQYRSGIYFSTPEQEAVAKDLLREMTQSGVYQHPIVTEVLPLANCWPAEDYHQDFFERNLGQGYCLAVAAPKVAKFRKTFAGLSK